MTRDDVSNEALPVLPRRAARGRHGARCARCASRTSASSASSCTIRSRTSAHLYDAVLEAGEPLGLVDFGYRALESMRLEKCYRLWGADMSADWTPLEAGLERFVAFDKGDFVGRDALLREREAGSPGRALLPRRRRRRRRRARPRAGLRARRAGRSPTSPRAATATRSSESIALAYLPIEHAAPGTELDGRDPRRAPARRRRRAAALRPGGRAPPRLTARLDSVHGRGPPRAEGRDRRLRRPGRLHVPRRGDGPRGRRGASSSHYHAHVRQELERFGGTVEKFIGDAVIGRLRGAARRTRTIPSAPCGQRSRSATGRRARTSSSCVSASTPARRSSAGGSTGGGRGHRGGRRREHGRAPAGGRAGRWHPRRCSDVSCDRRR